MSHPEFTVSDMQEALLKLMRHHVEEHTICSKECNISSSIQKASMALMRLENAMDADPRLKDWA